MKKLFTILTGGRPMVYIRDIDVSPLQKERVMMFKDKLGRYWIANKWSLIRIKIK